MLHGFCWYIKPLIAMNIAMNDATFLSQTFTG